MVFGASVSWRLCVTVRLYITDVYLWLNLYSWVFHCRAVIHFDIQNWNAKFISVKGGFSLYDLTLHFLAFQDTITYKTKPDSLIEHQLKFFHKAKLEFFTCVCCHSDTLTK